MGQITVNSDQCILGRLNYHSKLSKTIKASYLSCAPETRGSGMADKPEEINIIPKPNYGAPRFFTELYSDDGEATGKETKGLETLNTTSSQQPISITTHNPQSNNENSGSTFRDLSSTTVVNE
ncbi:hypothetical protein G6F56_004411 [Rhizopus delemar]|nr:hypothetical protein G6F56_004411 [Rhizopus delemar]